MMNSRSSTFPVNIRVSHGRVGNVSVVLEGLSFSARGRAEWAVSLSHIQKMHFCKPLGHLQTYWHLFCRKWLTERSNLTCTFQDRFDVGRKQWTQGVNNHWVKGGKDLTAFATAFLNDWERDFWSEDTQEQLHAGPRQFPRQLQVCKEQDGLGL